MNKKYIIFAFLIFIFQTGNVGADGASLHSFIQIALEHNLNLKSERLSLANEETNLSKAKKEEFYPEIEFSSVIGEKSWKSTWEGEQKQKVTTNEKPSIELSSSISRPHIFGGKIKLNLKTTEVLRTTSQDKWELSLESEEPISGYQRQNIKDPLIDEKLQLDMANLNLTERINDVIYDVVSSYCDLQRIDSSLNIKCKELEDLQANLEIARLKLEKGLIPEMDIFQMELQGSSVLTEIESLKKDKKAQMAKFYQVLGTETALHPPYPPPAGDIHPQTPASGGYSTPLPCQRCYLPPAGDMHPLLPPVGDRIGEINQVDLLTNIPQIKVKHIQIELAKRKLKEAEVKNLPVFVPSFNMTNERETREKSVKVAVKFPLYDKGIKKEELKLALNELTKQEIELDKLIKDTGIEITTTLDEIKDKERRISVLEKEIGLAEKIYEIAKIRHSRGLIPAKDLLDYQRDVFQKQKTIFEEQIGIFLDYVQLLKIRGELYHAYQKDIL